MYEVEVKVRADHEEVRDRLDELGANPLGKVTQEDFYYDAPHRDFAETDEALRVRREAGDEETVEVVTYKGPLVEEESKTRKEHETVVGDGDTVDALLSALGFDATETVHKERERFELDSYIVTLDSVMGLGEFVEVEAEAAETDVESVREGAYDVLTDLNLDPNEQVRTSYLGLLLADTGE
ncbi:adenylate cyclase, class 2 [Haladaptatus litoreus]|uniref:Adenylate cyclase, class 2 n=1 Tax=Haladaptatus litoreus TaxID=553468 RepID=A0A1N6YJC0_9EURY|nr:class IV adenylate cyclase [Haladaptatus litoreus]SIR14694.1 adenylate cyclase, class 2 [Haladaptatus litoreus]